MDNLQYWLIERSGVVKAKDIALDPASNAMYIRKSGIGFEPTVLFSRAPMIVMYSIKGRGSL